jgi:3-oxoacyl-[acyl-carrier protein] reductase
MAKSVLITGASRGIGLAIAKAFAEQGASIIGLYRSNQVQAEKALAELQLISEQNKQTSQHQFYQLDIADTKALERFTEQQLSHQQIDILVNNAGIYQELDISESNCEFEQWQANWQQTLSVNLMAPANLAFLVSRQMIQANQGRIINISSRGAFRGEPDAMAYGASKAAINSLTQSLAKKLAPYNIAVSAVAPGFVETDMVADLLASDAGDAMRAQSPFNRVAQPQDVAAAVLYLASDAAEFASGTIIDVNGASYLRS